MASLFNLSTTNSTNNTVFNNGTRPRFGQPPTKVLDATNYIMSVLFCFLIFCILAGNLLVLSSVGVNRRLRTKTNYFILSLAFADMLIGICSVPYYVYLTLSTSSMPDDFYQVWLAIDVTIGVASIMNLTMISLERGYALLRPIQHRNIRKATILAMAGLAWVLGILAGSLKHMADWSKKKDTYGTILFSVFFLVPLTLILVTYAIIFKIASAHAHGRGVRSFKKDLRIATTVAVVIGLFTINWLPFFSLNFFFAICRNYGVQLCGKVPFEVGLVTKLMQYGNSACNPIIYGFRNKDFKITFKKIIYKIIGKDISIASYNHSTYATRNTRRVVRTESSFDESMVRPEQIVPPGMYDMRNSYRSAIARGPRNKKPAKNNIQRKGLAQGLMSLNVETFSMPVSSDVNSKTSQSALSNPDDVTTTDNQSTDVNCNTAANNDSKPGASSDIEVYPMDDKSSHKGAENSAFQLSHENVTGVHFGNSNGISNGGLCRDAGEGMRDSMTNHDNKGRSQSVLTPDAITQHTDKTDRSVSFT